MASDQDHGRQRQPEAASTANIPESHERPLMVPAPRLQSVAAFAAEACFFGDFCIALALPMAMMVSSTRALSLDDPRVGAVVWATSGAAPDTLPAGLEAKVPLCPTPAASGALEGFPYGSSLSVQVLHVARHLVWYALLRPAQLGDWAGLLLNCIHLLCAVLLLLLAVSSRTAAVWTWWRRYRLAFVLVASLLGRCVLLLATFLLLPPHTWASHTWAAYVVNATASPVAHALATCAFSLLVKVPLPAAAVQALAHTAAVYALAYQVAPTIVTRWREQQPPGAGQQDDGPVPLRCGSPLHPEHSALLSCRPLALQVLLGLAMVAWPVGLSWAVERRLRRQHAAMWERRRGQQQGQQKDAPSATTSGQQHALEPSPPPCSEEKHPHHVHRGRADGTALGSACRASGDTSSHRAPAEAQAVGPGSAGASIAATIAHGRSAQYRSRMATVMATVKVQEHPGDLEAFGRRLASVLQDCVREELDAAAAAGGSPGQQPSPAGARVSTTVIRGCVQVVLWGWVPEGQGEEREGAGGVGLQGVAEQLLQRLAAQLGQGLAKEEAGSVRGVSVQVGQVVMVLWDPSQGMQLPGVMPRHGDSGGAGGSSSSFSVRLLQLTPPAASLAAAAESAPLAVRLLLHSPVPQMARVLVLSERTETASSSRSRSGEPHGGGGGGSELRQHPTPATARPLLELPVQLVGGVQEVGVELGAGQLAEVCKGEEAAGGVAVLQVMMVGPEHQAVAAFGQQQAAAAPPPLVHWVAPPLLLLPPAAAAEVCGVWEAVQWEPGAGPVETEEEVLSRHQQQQQPGGEEEQFEEGGSPGTGLAPLSITSTLPATAERRSSLWWSHMAPLLGDLAHALGGYQQGQGQEGYEEAADPVWRTLLPYLQARGMAETLSLLGSRRGQKHVEQQQQQQRLGTSGSSSAAAAPTTAHPGAAASDQPSAPTTGTHGSSSSCQQATALVIHQPPACSAAGVAAVTTRGGNAGWPFRFLLSRPFSSPHLEAAYQAWRLAGLAANVYYVLGASALVYLSMVLRLYTVWANHGDNGGSSTLPAAVAWAQLARATRVATLNTVANGLALAVVKLLVVVRSRAAQQQQQQLRGMRGQGVGGPAAAAGSDVGLGAGACRAVLQPSDVWVYRLAACVAGPAALLLSSILVVTGATPVDTQMVRNTRTVHATCLLRAVVVPCLQQMSTWEAVAASPLLGIGETLMLLSVQPGWGVWRCAGAAAACRLGAVGVSAAWEWRSRRRFVRGQRGSQSGRLEGRATGGGSSGAKVKAA